MWSEDFMELQSILYEVGVVYEDGSDNSKVLDIE